MTTTEHNIIKESENISKAFVALIEEVSCNLNLDNAQMTSLSGLTLTKISYNVLANIKSKSLSSPKEILNFYFESLERYLKSKNFII